jgi:hypothetical protein
MGVAVVPRLEAWGRLSEWICEVDCKGWKGELRCDTDLSRRCRCTKWTDIFAGGLDETKNEFLSKWRACCVGQLL